jgi:hypothetical protein
LISRRKDDPSKSEGRDYLEAYEKDSVKDVVLLGSNEVVEVLAKFQPYPGVYVCSNSLFFLVISSNLIQMFHCHNAVHSDQGMMSVFNVTRLADLGYNGLDTRLEDPMDARFQAKAYTGTDINEIKSKTLPYFLSLNAYPDGPALAEIEDRYWSSRTPPSGDKTGPDIKGGGMMSGMNGMGGMSGMGGMGNMGGNSKGGQSAGTPKAGGMGNMGGNMASHHGGQAPTPPKPSSAGSMSGMTGDMSSHHGGAAPVPSAPKPSSAGSMAGMTGDMSSHHGGAAPVPSPPKPSSMGSMGGMTGDMSSHHGGVSPVAVPSAVPSASHAGMSTGGMGGMDMSGGNMASHHGGGGMMGMRRT